VADDGKRADAHPGDGTPCVKEVNSRQELEELAGEALAGVIFWTPLSR
jgi:hypothetical protein